MSKHKILGLNNRIIPCNRIFLGVLILLLSINFVAAMGIRPAKTFLLAEEYPVYTGTFWVVNNDQEAFTAKVGVNGELSRYVTLRTVELRFREDIDALPVEFEVRLPAEVPPGESTAWIVIEQSLDESTAGVVSSKVALKHKLVVQGEYPDKYLKTKLNFQESGQKIRLVSEVENLGKLDLERVQTKFYVDDKEQKQQVLETESTPLKHAENKLLEAHLDRKLLEQGEFEVLAITTYDDQKVELTKKLLIGRPEIDITYFDKYFIANKINQYSLDLLNKWNTPIENVFVDVEVKKSNEPGDHDPGGHDQSDERVDSFRTKSVDLDTLATKRINDYYDARNKNPGKYSFDMVVHFWDIYRMSSKTFHSELLTKEEFENLNLAPPLVGAAAGGNDAGGMERKYSLSTILWWGLIGILLGAVGFYLLYRYRHREQYE